MELLIHPEELKIRDVDFDNQSELHVLAQLYVKVPLSWDPNYSVTEDMIQQNYEWLLAKRDFLKCIIIMSKLEMVGIHILYKEPTSPSCFIKTLWLNDKIRSQGFGTKLKSLGEEWALNQGARKIVTHVMANNPTMLEINMKAGFAITKFEMTKDLRP